MWKEIDQRLSSGLKKPNFRVPQKSADGQPEIVSHHDDALDPAPVALPQGLHQFGVLVVSFGMQPLLELVQNDHHLLARFGT